MTERRLMLGVGVGATVLIPSWLRPAIAWAATRHAHHRRLLHDPSSALHREAPLVMLDPGHGGKDPGAIGVAGTYEKHVALAAAYDLKRRLEASGRYRVAMTRSTDRFIPLEDRVAIAQDRGAALFVSMHADSVPDHAVRGASVYTLSSNASDRQTAGLAIRENSADRFAGPGFKGVSPAVARILASLVGRETRIGSARLQQDMVANLGRSIELLPRPARHAAFVVLKSAEIPSVLVEMGFMSNYKDESELRQQGHRDRITQSMADAVDAWYVAQRTARMAG
ncbi:MAG: N-acetylmuramoyl-L-alanine amidase [Proteobacteria bacterium]|nr:N-acetylmuramoyl-L-alanine amidase [Pseudomonadota bacterium]